MSMNKTLLAGAAAAALFGGSAMADEPVTLTDTQMDDVTAGFLFAFAGTGGFGFQIGSVTNLGTADVEEKSSTPQSETSSLSSTPTSAMGMATADAEATAYIKGSFGNVTLATMATAGTLAFTGNL
jgi:hypothetical protein